MRGLARSMVEQTVAAPKPALAAFAAGLTVASVVGGLLSLTAAVVIATVVATVGTGVSAFVLIRLSLRIHARAHSFGPCRGAGYLGLGTAVAAATTAVAGVLAAVSGPSAATIALQMGTATAATSYATGLLLLPGAAPTVGARLRHGLDGAGIGTAVFLVTWLLVLAPADRGVPSGAQVLVGLTVSVALAVTVITGLRAAQHRPLAMVCAAGAALAVVGMALPALGRQGPGWLLAAGVALVSGPPFMIFGASRATTAPAGGAAAPYRGGLAAHPLLAVPVAAAVGAAAYHAVTVGSFDRVAGTVGILLIGVVVLRESLGALDVRRYATRLSEQQARFQALVAGSADLTMVLDTELVVRWQSPAAARLFGLSDQDVLDRPFLARVHTDDARRVADRLTAVLAGTCDSDEPVRSRLRDGNGCWRDTDSVIRDMRFAPEVGALVVHVRDVADVAGLQRRLDDATRTDPLTGLPNERRLLELTASRLATGSRAAIVVVGLHGVAGVNELYGTAAGDAVLVQAAERIRADADADDVVARLSGQRFAVLTGCSALRAYPRAGRFVEAVAEPYELSCGPARVTACAGVADLHGPVEPDLALWHAATAADRAHARGPGRVEGYDEGLAAALRRRATIEQTLASAIRAGAFDLVYQPVIDLKTKLPVAVEALLRWRLPDIGLVPPLEVVAAAEELGCVDELDTRVLRRACRQLARWRREGHDLTVAVNMSPWRLKDDELPAIVDDALTRTGVPADRLIMEVAARDVPTTAVLPHQRAPDESPRPLAALRDLGVRVALDHFGSGSLGLAQLPHLPVDLVKVDRSLFAEPSSALVDVVITLGNRLGFEVAAVGVETETDLATLRSAGCVTGQGNLLGAPAHAERVEAYLDEHRARRL
jgi:diguanylate cyclase (GGDEF)-like protein/PAS domain S-box-containing protein